MNRINKHYTDEKKRITGLETKLTFEISLAKLILHSITFIDILPLQLIAQEKE